jgi:virginiamycin B lyase
MRVLIVSALILAIGCSGPVGSLPPHPSNHPALAVGGVVEYTVLEPRASLSGMTAGPDGNVWFVDVTYGASKVGRITPSGTITEFDVPGAVGGPETITAGPDGNLWMAANGAGASSWILSISPVGTIRQFSVPSVDGIASGPDGNVWFTEFFQDVIGRITTAGVVTEFPIGTGNGGPRGIVTGPDGNLWFTETAQNGSASGGQIARMTTSGSVTEYPLGGSTTDQRDPTAIVVGPDGNLWFTEAGDSRIGRITTKGQLTEFLLPASGRALGLTVGPDGNLWFTDVGGNAVGRISPGGVIRSFGLPRRNSQPIGIAAGSDGRLWFTEIDRVASIGEKVPEVAVSRLLSFGTGLSPTSRTVTVTNTGDARLSISSVKVVGSSSAAFKVDHDTCAGQIVAVGASCQLDVAFEPMPGQGVLAARLELADNATGSPQIVSVVAQLPDCKLPVFTRSEAPVAVQGWFLNLRTDALTSDAKGLLEYDQGAGLYHSTATPTLFGVFPTYYDTEAGRWLPTDSASISPDHARYAYANFNSGLNRQVHVVDVATGRDRALNLPSGPWNVIGFGNEGIYVQQAYEGIGPGLTLVDPDSGAVRAVFADSVVFQVADGAAWVGMRNQADALPPTPGMGESFNEIARRDLATAQTVAWFYLSGANLYASALGGGKLLVIAYDNQGPQTWLVSGPNQAVHLTVPGTVEEFSYSGGFMSDGERVWLAGPGGVYLWSSGTGLILVSDVVATPAGSCV